MNFYEKGLDTLLSFHNSSHNIRSHLLYENSASISYVNPDGGTSGSHTAFTSCLKTVHVQNIDVVTFFVLKLD